ncbi:MAG: hypothetical protein K0S88_5547 [Actinomycetia bacterium]|jgi:hypothetical protein|nr:hypothetical protein [Actinomycetes bacterium]
MHRQDAPAEDGQPEPGSATGTLGGSEDVGAIPDGRNTKASALNHLSQWPFLTPPHLASDVQNLWMALGEVT